MSAKKPIKQSIEDAMGQKAQKVTPWFDEETGQRMGYTLHFSIDAKKKRSKRKPENKRNPSS